MNCAVLKEQKFPFVCVIIICVFQPCLTDETRRSIGEAAVRAAKAVNYVGAGRYSSM